MNRGGTYEPGHETVARNEDREKRQAEARRKDTLDQGRNQRSI